MEPVVDKLKGFLKWSEEVAKGALQKRDKSSQYNPIEILKRLQREAFSDIMKLRDRQEKVEKVLSFYKSTKGSPFQESNTRVYGMVDVMGALLYVDNVDQETCDTLSRAGMMTGIDSRFIFETTIRQKDVLAAELQACQDEQSSFGDFHGGPLSLTKVMYTATVSDWCSAVAIPLGARCRDVAIASNSLQQEQSLTKFPSFRPPLLDQNQGAAMGLMVQKSNIAAALAGFVSEVEMQTDSAGIRSCFNTFGQIIYRLSKGTKLTLFGLHKRINAPSQHTGLRKFTIPFVKLRRREALDASPTMPSSPDSVNAEEKLMDGSVALMLESELDDSTRIGGWVEMQNSSPKCLQWAVSMSDTPENELGWGLSLAGMIQDPATWDHFQAEAFLKFNVGDRVSLQPGLVYVMDGRGRIPALMFRTNWTL